MTLPIDDAAAEAFLARYSGRDGKDTWADIKRIYREGGEPLLLVPEELADIFRRSAIAVIAEIKPSKYLQGTTIYILDKKYLDLKRQFTQAPPISLVTSRFYGL